jgi:hypothetical protein
LGVDAANKLVADVTARLGMTVEQIKEEVKFAAIIIFNYVVDKG